MPDDRWQARPNALVEVDPDQDKLSPPGIWQVLAHGPDSPTSWWLMPISHEAITWVAHNAAQVINRCVQIPGNRLRSHHQLALFEARTRG